MSRQIPLDCVLAWDGATRTWRVVVRGRCIARFPDAGRAAEVALLAYGDDDPGGKNTHHTCHKCPWAEPSSGDRDLCEHDADNPRVIDPSVDPQPWCPLFDPK